MMQKFEELSQALSVMYDTEPDNFGYLKWLLSRDKPSIKISNNFIFEGYVDSYSENRLFKSIDARVQVKPNRGTDTVQMINIMLPYGDYSLVHRNDELVGSKIYGSGHTELNAVLSGVLQPNINLVNSNFCTTQRIPIGDDISGIIADCDRQLTSITASQLCIDSAFIRVNGKNYRIRSKKKNGYPSIEQLGAW